MIYIYISLIMIIFTLVTVLYRLYKIEESIFEIYEQDESHCLFNEISMSILYLLEKRDIVSVKEISRVLLKKDYKKILLALEKELEKTKI